MSGAIYKIVNLVNDKFYVGSTNNTKIRFRQHRKLLRGNRHHCKHLQAAWNLYGELKFAFVVMERVENVEELEGKENTLLEEHHGKDYCYNAGRSSKSPLRGMPRHENPNFGRVVSEQQKQQISAKLKEFYAEDYFNHPRVGKVHSDETKAKISENRKGKMSGANHYRYGTQVSAEVRAKISATQKGKPNKMKGKKMSEQGRANVIAALKRGADSHFYGKRPAVADLFEKKISAALPDGTVRRFKSLSNMRDELGVSVATIIRACKSGKPVRRGASAGWVLSYEAIDTQ